MYNYDQMTQGELREIALHDEDCDVRCEAVKKLSDQETLKHIALRDTNLAVIDEAKNRLAELQK